MSLFIKQKTSYDILQYIKKEIIRLNKEYDKTDEITHTIDQKINKVILLTGLKSKIETLLRFSNKMYGKRVTNNYICKELGINNV